MMNREFSEFVKISEGHKPLPGDYIQYRDRWGNYKGSGILVKHVINKQKPLTESYYFLKNASTGCVWRAFCDRHEFYFMRHKTKNSQLSDYLRQISEKDE